MRTARPALPRATLGAALALGVGLGLAPRAARADDVLHVGTARLDPPTVISLGVQLLITGDDNFNAAVTLRYRRAGTSEWRAGLPLHRVHPEVVVGLTVPTQFAGSVFELAPGTMYDLELRAVDPDGGVDQTVMLSGATRPVPALEPATARRVAVDSEAALNAALAGARPGDVIVLADRTYTGEFAVNASGTADNPIVIRGTTRDGTVLDGGNRGANVLEVYGSYVHVEDLTLQHDNRALRFQGAGARANVVRRVRVRDVVLGIGSRQDQADFYLCDNDLAGRLTWPAVYSDDGGAHANDDGIHVEGNGHVVCHNRIVGFGDAMKVETDGARAVDFYGNEVLSAYDNGVELDATAGNARAFRNRFTNTYATLSFQPIYGGPAYAFRNVVVNVANEQLKLHSLGGAMQTSGIYVLHNTFVSPAHALSLNDDTTARYVTLGNNLFVGPAAPTGGLLWDYDAPIDPVTFAADYDGFAPDGMFRYGYGTGSARYANFAAVVAGGRYETHGVLLAGGIFASGLAAPTDYHAVLAPPDVALAAGSNAVDHGRVYDNLSDGFRGTAPDLGALEQGCPAPIYGPRPVGTDESNEPVGCSSTITPGGDGGAGSDVVSPGGDVVSPGGDGASPGGDSAGPGMDARGTGDGGTGGSGTGGCGCRTERSADGRGRGLTAGVLSVLGAGLRVRRRRRARTRG